MRSNRYTVQGYYVDHGWMSYGFEHTLKEAFRQMQGLATRTDKPLRIYDRMKDEIAFVHGL